MKRFIKSIKNTDFGSGTRTTPEFDRFFRQTRNDFKKSLSDIATGIELHKGHFYFSGFLTRISDGQVIYFSISDVRYFPNTGLLIRTAKDYRDYTGGSNHNVVIDENFEKSLKTTIINLKG